MSNTAPVLVPEGTYVGQVIDLEIKHNDDRFYTHVTIQSPTAPGLIYLYRPGMAGAEWSFIKVTGANVKVIVRHKTLSNGTLVCANTLLSIESRKD